MRLVRYIIAARPTGRRCWHTAHFTSPQRANAEIRLWRSHRSLGSKPVYATVRGPFKAVFHV